ncbi:MAG: transporter substrate-binding domain-containing protein [Acholeplasma sp.]|nr:transporter substrate-binding domain-containing protein [Acholeplasma sp.]
MKRIFSLLVIALAAITLIGCSDKTYDLEKETEIVIGLEAAYAPFNWTEVTANDYTHPIANQSGSYVDGYDVQVAKAIAASLDKILVIKAIEWDGLIPALKSGEIDAIIAGMSPTSERAEQILFTSEYYRSEVVMVVKVGGSFDSATTLTDFDGSKVVAQRGTLYDDLIDQITNVNHQTPLDAYSNLVTAVSSGASDAFIAEYPVAVAVTAANSNLKIIRFADGDGFEALDEDITVAIGLRKNDTALADAINTALASITETQRTTWMNEANNRQED